MGILTLIMTIIQILIQIPTIIKIIKQILDLIRGLPKGPEQDLARVRLKTILQNVKKKKTVSMADADSLARLLSDLEKHKGK